MASAGLLAAALGIPSASAQDDNGTFTLTVNKTAYTNQFKTAMTVSGSYTCAPTFIPDPNFTGLGVNVTQIQGKGVVVSGGSGFGPLSCDGQAHSWAVSDVFANFGSGPMGGMPATWKGGKAIANVNGNASTGECQPGTPCTAIGSSIDLVLQVH